MTAVADPDAPVDSETLLWAWLRNGWEYRLPDDSFLEDNPEQCGESVKYEMSVVIEKGFPDYFLMLSDLVRFAKDNGIAVGPARGSAAASFCCYLLRITEINPLRFPHMMFERFLDPSRDDWPDIDLDFDDERRAEVRQYAADKYGSDCVVNMGNFMRFRGKTAVNDVARVYRIPKWAAETINGLIIDRAAGDPRQNDSLADTFALFPRAAEILKQFPDLARAADLEGNYRSMGVHAAGLVISSRPITDTSAIYSRPVGKKKEIISVVSADLAAAKHLGMLKVDLLGLSTMSAISRALQIVELPLAELYRIPLDDTRTLQGFKDMDLTGIFQFEGRTQRSVTKKVSPDNFDHLVDISGLARPGPLFSRAEEFYVERRHGRWPIIPVHPVVDELTQHTYGTIVYQEQVLQIIARVGGFPATKVGDIRRIIGQKLGEAAFNAMFEEFAQGALDLHGIKPELAKSIWNTMVTSSKYLFNYAHCCSYAMLAFWSMYLKKHYPLAFYAGQLAKAGKEKLPRLLQDVINHDIVVLPPHPHFSEFTWKPEDLIRPEAPDALRAGLIQIPGIGDVTAQSMLNWRVADGRTDEFFGPSWEHYEVVKGIGPKTIEKMQDFAESDDPFELQRVRRVLREYREGIAQGLPDFRGLPRPTHTSDTIPETGTHTVVWMGFAKKIIFKNEVEKIRSKTGQSEADILAEMRDPHLLDSAVIQGYDDGEEDVYLRINRWAYPRLEEFISSIIPDEDVLIIMGTVKEGGFGVSIFVQSIEVLEQDEEEPEPDAFD